VRKDESKAEPEPASMVDELHPGTAGPQKQRSQRAPYRGDYHGKNHSKKEGDHQARRCEQVVDTGLKVRVRSVASEPLRDFHDGIGVFLLGMKNENPDGDQQRVDGECDYSRCSPKTRSESGRKDDSAFTAVEKNGQRSGQRDAEEWDYPDENAKHSGLEGSANGNAPVHRPAGRHVWAIEMPAWENLRSNLVRRGIQAPGNFSIRKRHLHVDLRSAALLTKRPAVFDRGATLLARVLHFLEASAQRSGEQGRTPSDH
jgi:hypothetical protein